MKDQRYKQFQTTLLEKASKLVFITGYNRLKSSIENVTDWDGFQAILAQINTILWFKGKGLVKEIEPKLPHREGYSDILLSFLNQEIYCEVTSPESIQKSIESEKPNELKKVQELIRKQPWMSEQDAEHEIRRNRIVRNLLYKTKRQIPPNNPGILVVETGKSAIFSFDIKKIAPRIFKNRPQVMLVMLWSLERGSQIGEAPFWFINTNTPYKNIGYEMLKYSEQDNKIVY